MTSGNNHLFSSFRVSILLLLIGFAACSPTREITKIDDEIVSAEPESETVFSVDLSKYPISPEELLSSVENQIPEVFQVDLSQSANRNPNAGFRVQIISTQDIELAENLRVEFMNWLDGQDLYTAEAYIQFRQPFYRLHVGDFTNRADAIEFSNLLKRRFPDAWVVFDTIDPKNLTIKKTGENTNRR